MSFTAYRLTDDERGQKMTDVPKTGPSLKQQSNHIIKAHVRTDEDQWFVEAVANKWWETYQADPDFDKPMAIDGARWRASWGGGCARYVAYKAVGMEPSNPMTAADCYRANIGTLLHEDIQKAMIATFGTDVVAERKVKIGRYGAGHVDLSIATEVAGRKVNVEIKTAGPTTWKMMWGPKGGAKVAAIKQAALCAMGEEERPAEIVLAYFSLEPSKASVRDANGQPPTEYGRFAAQWTIPREEYEIIGQAEIDRLDHIIDLMEQSNGDYTLVPRVIADPWMPTHEIVNPLRSQYVERTPEGLGKKLTYTWNCDYCEYQDTCHELKIKEIQEAEAKRLGEATEAVFVAFPGARYATPEEESGVKRQRPAPWDDKA